MSNLQKLSFALIGTAVIFMGANPASADTSPTTPPAVTIGLGSSTPTSNGIFSGVSGATTIDFNNGAIDPNGIATFSSVNNELNNSTAVSTSVSGVVSGDMSGVYATPAGDTSKYLAIENTDPVTILFSQGLDYFGLQWGSVDAYNSIAFYNGGNELASFDGTKVPQSSASGNQTNQIDNTFVNFFAAQGQTFNKIVLTSTAPAFETDNYAYRVAGTSVPESSSILGLLAFGGMGTVSALKRKQRQIV